MSKKTKDIDDLNEEVKFLKKSLDELRNSFSLIKQQWERFGTIFDWHGHTETRITSPPVFLKDQYDLSQKQQQQQQQRQPEPEKKTPESEKKGE